MIRRRGGAPSQEQESSSDDEDVFSALSLRTTRQQAPADAKQKDETLMSSPVSNTVETATSTTAKHKASLPIISKTSSMKRHHGSSDSRKAKMEAVLQQLEEDTACSSNKRPFVPEKMGSFVQPGEEHLTTNIFVGNLAPSITEEQMTDLFRQFGDLYSLKIMWPRTPEEKARNRHTGFVCFMNRQDAEDAMEACDETDPFRVGRRIMMRWGKNVKKVSNATMTPFATKRTNDAKRPRFDNEGTTTFLQESLGGSDAIQVVIPKDPKRARFITTIASFVAKDGSLLEQRFIAQEFQNPNFSFLTYNESMNLQQKEEYLFYKWRVYAFCQGDGLQTWRMEPFQMFADNHRGRFWIPPPVNRAAAMQEEQASVEREQRIRQQKAQRRRGRRNEYLTGRQLEQARSYSGGAADGSAQMTENELKDFRALTRDKLCASREAICNAMAYCFEKSGAAKQIANLLRELLLDNGPPGVSVDTRIARLYLLSDVLYNSQQPGVRNAFLYRDAIERMAPDVFASLGKHGHGKIGRMTFMKLKTAVSSILSAWTNWSVYNPTFIDELEARFDGREVAPSAKSANDTAAKSSSPPPNDTDHPDDAPVAESATVLKPRGDWKEVAVDDDKVLVPVQPKGVVTVLETMTENQDDDSDVDGEPLDDDDLDGESLGDEDFVMDGTADGKTDQAQNKKPAGEESDELDGEPL